MKTQLIAEIAQAHDGSLGILHSFIDALAETGVQTIKFQIHNADAESSEFEKFRIPFSYVDKTRKAYWKRMEFSYEQWKDIKRHVEENDMEFLATPFSIAAVDLLESLDVKRYKVGSGDVGNLLLLDKIAQTGKPILLSSGMSDWNELEETISFLKAFESPLSLLQCTSLYPCPPEKTGLRLIPEMKKRFGLPVGYSDHSGTISAGICAVALAAELLEFHVCFDKRMFGPDAIASLTIEEVNQLVAAVEFAEAACGQTELKESMNEFSEMRTLFGKSLAVKHPLNTGHLIQKADLETKKPAGYGIPAADFQKLLGKKIIHSMHANQFINWSDVE